MLVKPTILFQYYRGILDAPRVRSVMLIWIVFFVVHGAGTDYRVAHAGAIAPSCGELIVFEGANVNNYVKQFAGVTDLDLPLDKAGKMLSLLIQLDGLYSQIGYGPLGYVYIKTAGSPEACHNELIRKRILGQACWSSGILQDGKSAILLSGHFQLINNQIYLLTSLDFFRKGISETVFIPSRTVAGKSISFVANLPDTAVSFTPRKFTNEQLALVAHNYSDAMDVREKPDETLPSTKINPFDIDGFSYYVEQRPSHGWLKIRAFKPGLPSGWIKLQGDIGGRGLRELLPELYFVDATAIYLQTRIARNSFSAERYRKHLLKFVSLEREFALRTQGGGDRRALGLLKSMRTVLMLEKIGANFTAEEMKRIYKVAAEGAKLLPTSSAARSLAELTWFAAEDLSHNESFSTNASALEKNLLRVLSTDPANVHVKTSLEQLWRLRRKYDKTKWQTENKINLRERFRNDENVKQLLNKSDDLIAPSRLQVIQ